MTTAVAEKLHIYPNLELVSQPPELPLVIPVYEIIPTDLRAERLIRAAGSMAIEQQIESIPPKVENSIENLKDAIHRAADGNPIARNMMEANVRTANTERTFKAGNITQINLEEDDEGNILQNGQPLEIVQKNTLTHAYNNPKMRPRVQAETRNAFSLNAANKLGLLEDYYYLVASGTADDMTEEELDKADFFKDSMTMVFQGTTKHSGKLKMESAFVAGVKIPGEERHDTAAISEVGAELNVDYSNKNMTQILATPLFVHKSLLPNGMVDIVKIYDEAVGGVFFGEAKPPQDYLAYREFCREREASFEPRVQKIVNQLIAEKDHIKTPVDATRRLSKLSEEQMVEQSVTDRSINPRVFGPAAPHIEEARIRWERGDIAGAAQQTNVAKTKAKSSDCPGGASSGSGPDSGELDSGENGGGESGSSDECEFISKQCPICKKKNVKTKVTKTHIEGDCGCKKRKT